MTIASLSEAPPADGSLPADGSVAPVSVAASVADPHAFAAFAASAADAFVQSAVSLHHSRFAWLAAGAPSLVAVGASAGPDLAFAVTSVVAAGISCPDLHFPCWAPQSVPRVEGPWDERARGGGHRVPPAAA